jgi:HD-like signal output (HDOD) protein
MKERIETSVRIPQNFFRDLSDKERITLFNTGKIRAVGARQLLFSKGSTDHSIYCVLSGSFMADIHGSGRHGFRFKPGEWIAEMGFYSARGKISTVTAEEESTVLGFDQSGFQTLDQETRTAILKKLHDHALGRVEILDRERESAQLQAAALSRYIGSSFQKPLLQYEKSEIILNIIKNIPRLPLHITRLIDLLASEKASAKDVADVAKQDPSLVVDILKVINSSRYALQKEISDVSYAITYMGFNEVYQIAVSRGLLKSMPDSESFREIYLHSLFLSYIIFELCQQHDKDRAALMSTVALLHDIGDSILLLLTRQNPKWSLFIEMLDAGKVGSMLLNQWNIPGKLCQTIEHQAYPRFCPPAEIPSGEKQNIALLYIAHAIYERLCNRPVEALDHPFINDYLRFLKFKEPLDTLAREVVLKGLKTKSQRLPDFVRKFLVLSSQGSVN